ncbi:SfnB family sulfur acquisition oxidoreductase [Gordonia hankookensis]|uniref:Dibenzothiophene monooxygenase n=1 Tax=Gordonia hankookensis TaxID=589403 RepID=A0ABR7W910_9ACTN|nr:SfnB family sulfur acquisition oxidoreductase [Gordonia hankookensis]MBD1319311.1 SfnB family sulfur acquisition oxidoreductase [Gordonia hankookensis]
MHEVPVLGDHEAIAIAAELGAEFAKGAAERDRSKILPFEQVAKLAASGLTAITVPDRFGGAGLPASTVAEVIRLIAKGDPNIGQIPHSHFVFINQLLLQGSPEQQARILPEVLAGKTLGNAQSERGTRHIRDYATTLRPDPSGDDGLWRLNGTKFYCTGALFADWIPTLAHLGEDGPLHVAWVRRDADGVEVVDDWEALGQRTTASGTVRLTDVVVTADLITDFSATFTGPTTYGAFAQLLHAAIDAGIARAALEDAAEFVTTKSRPHPDAGVERAADDPLVVHAFGEMELAVRGAEALLAEAGRAVDRADADLDETTAAAATLAVAAARASTTKSSVDVASRLFEVAGTRSAVAKESLDRHWRNARTHTLHDPAAWKVQHLGRWAAEGILPPRTGQL